METKNLTKEEFDFINQFFMSSKTFHREYIALLEYFDNTWPGLHNVFGDVLDPWLVEKLQSNESDKNTIEELNNVFIFFEKIIDVYYLQ